MGAKVEDVGTGGGRWGQCLKGHVDILPRESALTFLHEVRTKVID